MNEQEKREIVKRALAEGLIHDPKWLERLDEPMPAWAVFELTLNLLERLDPPSFTYD